MCKFHFRLHIGNERQQQIRVINIQIGYSRQVHCNESKYCHCLCCFGFLSDTLEVLTFRPKFKNKNLSIKY